MGRTGIDGEHLYAHIYEPGHKGKWVLLRVLDIVYVLSLQS